MHDKIGTRSNAAFSGQLEATAVGTQIIGNFTVSPQDLQAGLIAFIIMGLLMRGNLLPTLYIGATLLAVVGASFRSKLGRETLAQFMEATLD